MKKIRWGIAGPGIIAKKFAEAIFNVSDADLVAVASRSYDRADVFAKEFNIDRVFSSYEEMAESDLIDAVYVSTIHPYHESVAEIFLNAKKHVLCEKPMCVNARQAKRLKECAKRNGVFLMEAMWSRFLPAIVAAEKVVTGGEIGDVMGVSADFCYSIEIGEDPKLFENSLSGGSLLDVGVYALHIADMFIKANLKQVSVVSNIQNGVDYHTQMLLKYDNGSIADLSSAIKLEKPFSCYVYGTKGHIYLPDFYKADRFTVSINDGEKREEIYLYGDNGFEFEIEEVCRCVRDNKTQSDILPLSKTIEIIEQMDEIRKQIGLKYPCDAE